MEKLNVKQKDHGSHMTKELLIYTAGLLTFQLTDTLHFMFMS